MCAALPETISFTGDLRSNATFIGCGPGCSLGAASSDGDYAQYAAAVDSFLVPVTSTMSAITFSYGGGTNGNGKVIDQGGFEPYLSLFDSTGDFLASTFFGSLCPTGTQANSTTGFCYDVGLDGGVLTPGTYQIAISAFENLSDAENAGYGLLSDGFTGLGNLASGEDLHYGFDVILTTATPEPSSTALLLVIAPGIYLLRKKHRKAK